MLIITPSLHLAYTKHIGPIHSEHLIDFVIDLARHPHYTPDINVLYDHRRTNFDPMGSEGMESVSRYLSGQRKNLYGKVAIVVKNERDFHAACQWQSHAGPQLQPWKVFKSMIRAEIWLFKSVSGDIRFQYHQMNRRLKKARQDKSHCIMDHQGTILWTSATPIKSLKGPPVTGQNISDILHPAYAYPFMCKLKKVIKTHRPSWITTRVRNCEFAEHLIPRGRNQIEVCEFNITNMWAYEVERMKWRHDTEIAPKV